MSKDDTLKEQTTHLLKLSRYIDYKNRFSKKDIKKSKSLLKKLIDDIEKGEITLDDRKGQAPLLQGNRRCRQARSPAEPAHSFSEEGT